MRVLFVTSGSIGDVVISTGLLRHVLTRYPEARITVAAGPASIALFEGFPACERCIGIVKQPRHRHWWTLWNAVCGTRWDAVIDLRSSLISYVLRTRARHVFRGGDKTLPKAAQLAALFGLPMLPPPLLYVSDDAAQNAASLVPPGPFLALVPKSNAAFKDWPIERFTALAERWLSAHPSMPIVVLGLPNQREGIAPLLAALPAERVIDLVGRTSMPVAAAVMQRARLALANDSGLLHIAAALGTPILGLYGPTNAARYAPGGAHVKLVTARAFRPEEEEIKDEGALIRTISVDQAYAAAEALFNASATSSAA